MYSLEEEARIHANLNEDFDFAEESYYQPTKINAYMSFQAGANSKYVEAEKIKAQIDAYTECLNDICWEVKRYHIGKRIEELKQQLKQLEDESNH